MSRVSHIHKQWLLCNACKRTMTRGFTFLGECAPCRALRTTANKHRLHVEPGIVSKRRA